MKKPDAAAVMHIIAGFLEEQRLEVTPGRTHDCSGIEATFILPNYCTVGREEGTAGHGFNKGKSKPLELSQDAVLLVLECVCRTHKLTAAMMLPIWLEAIKGAQRGHKVTPPPEALQALAEVGKEIKPQPVRTQAKRNGAKEVKFTYKRIQKPAKPAKKRKAHSHAA